LLVNCFIKPSQCLEKASVRNKMNRAIVWKYCPQVFHVKNYTKSIYLSCYFLYILISIIIMFVKQNKKTIIIIITNLRVLIIIIITNLRVLVKKNYRYHYNKLKVFAVLFGSILKQKITGYNIKIKCNSIWFGWLFLKNSIQQKQKDDKINVCYFTLFSSHSNIYNFILFLNEHTLQILIKWNSQIT